MQIKKYIFIGLYILLLVCNTLYSNLHFVGPITYRHLCTIGLLLFLIIQGRQYLKVDKYFGTFLVFVFFWGIGAVVTGYSSQFANKFFGTTLNAYVAYQSTKYLINKYDCLHVLILSFLCIGFVDCVCTIMQFYNQPVGYMIPRILHADFIEEFEEFAGRRMHAGDTAIVIPGIIGGASHGYFSSCLAIISLYPFKNKLGITNIFMWAFSIISLFFIQERTAFAVGLLGSIYCLYRLTKQQSEQTPFMKIFIRLISIVAVYGIIHLLYNTLGSVDTRYTAFGMDAMGRDEFIQNAFDYLKQNPLGGYFEYSATGAMPPHNMFVNAFVWGGILGGFVVIVLILRQLKEVISALLQKTAYIPVQAIMFAVIYLVYTGNAMFHNESMVNGSSITWIYWAVFLTYYDNWKNQNFI